ncbi:MAG: putative histidine kinase, atypical unorthodox [Ramlibacter sp.]|jgi:two-component system CAI-1 autoinducer sensor kinase/phosphatase CqsS|uniref:ATP-binding response regulator n=1 Tax=Ramlibacter sp. TaxID=1917967 RepID=UPI002634FFDA|nr:response regulator [Ramlibacter sp.]MDB5750142.1 putative histidine kinase, atypical unorthodox [Ramlibacter sp.]
MLMGLARGLFKHYEDYHAYGPSRLKAIGVLGAITYCIFYFMRFTRPDASLTADLGERALAIILFAILGLRDYWPEKLKPYYIRVSYVVVLYSLPCFTVLVALQRSGGVANISNAFIVLSFLVLLTDWRNTLVMLAAGTGLAAAIYWATTPDPQVPMDLVAQLPAFALIVIGGNLFKSNTDKIDAERKLRATQALAGSIAHEMRHPLAQLKHSLEGMQEVLPAPGAARQTAKLDAQQVQQLYRHLARGEQAVQRGLQVISMTLDEVSARPIDASAFRHLSAAEVVHQAVEEYSYDNDAARDKVTVTVADDFTFKGDETAYLFVLFNLIKNALYYLAPYPQTRVTITIGNQQVKVHDNGPGIAPDALHGLFEPFRSVGKSGGTGLGLAYCQRVMRAFGGEISCVSVPGQSTEFTMRFPGISEEEREAHWRDAVAEARAVLAGKRVLIVEDDAVQRMATRHKLGPLAVTAELDEAADGQLAIDLLTRRAYDIVLLDLHMPGLDGYAVAEKIRNDPGINQDARIVAYSSEPAHLARAKALKGGMDGFISKPCAQLPLLAALQQSVQQPRGLGRHAPGRLAGRRILLADDSSFSRKAVAAYLRNAAATVIEAEHGQAVLDQLNALEGFDAIILDLHMPGMDGLETAQAIRSSSAAWSTLPVVALTAHSDEQAVAAARAAGMDGFLVKPVESAHLYETLVRLLGGSAVASPAVTQPLAQGPPPVPDAGLLNLQRLESYRRLGMVEELLEDYVPEMAKLVLALQEAGRADDQPLSLGALHSLLGMSGEAGAQALYQHVRRIYVPLLEQGQWPAGENWLAELQALAARTESALKAYCETEFRSNA